MAKFIKYAMIATRNTGSRENPIWEEIPGYPVKMTWSESNEEIAKREAYNGEYIIEDDGQPDLADNPTEIEALDARLTYVEMMTGLLEV